MVVMINPLEYQVQLSLAPAKSQTGRKISGIEGHTSDVSAVAFSPDGKLVTSAS